MFVRMDYCFKTHFILLNYCQMDLFSLFLFTIITKVKQMDYFRLVLLFIGFNTLINYFKKG